MWITMQWFFFFNLLLVLFLQVQKYRKYQKRKKELKGIHGLLTDFCIFPGQFFTTKMEYGVWGSCKFWEIDISEILKENHCTTKNSTKQIKNQTILANVLEEQMEYFKLLI